MLIEGIYLDGKTSKRHMARLEVNNDHRITHIHLPEQQVLSFEYQNYVVESRLGNTSREILFDDEQLFICDNHDLVFIDTKKQITDSFKNCSFIKINKVEYANSIEYINKNEWTKKKIIQTVGSDGCRLGDEHYTVEKVEIKDLCGAGDTFIASLSVKFLKTRNIYQSMIFANECATKVVQSKGVNIINEF